jgi:hypothetical protein
MNGIQFAIFVGIIFAAVVLIPRAIQYDRVMAELEGLDDDSLAEAWERGEL